MRMWLRMAGIALCASWATEARSGSEPVCPPGSGRCAQATAKVSDFCAHIDRNVEGFLDPPYRDTKLLYGYYDHVVGRGPLITLGSRNLLPGFRGYGLLGSPGYGIGLRPTSAIDLKHVNGGPWYHKFPRRYVVPPELNFDPGTPRRRL
jgi:hypothetical protein